MLTGMKKILYASDMEPGSRPAFRQAMSLCGHYQSEITFLHVVEPLPASAQNLVRNIMDQDELEQREKDGMDYLCNKVTKRIDRFCATELEESDHLSPENIKTRVERGLPWKVILEVAEEIEADVIVMGARHHSAMEKFFMGSTANKILYRSKIPVMIVPLEG
ncbi:universal stress protein [Endozoicomonadaceae bacterium StTr2]